MKPKDNSFPNATSTRILALMYPTLLALHSLFRWLVLASLLIAVTTAFTGWIKNKPFTQRDNAIRHWTATIAHIQLLIGIVLYFISPIIDYFLHHYSEAVHQRQIRFFGMEHSVVMVLAIIILTIGSMKAKRVATDQAKFKTMAIWFTLALLIILALIPFPFSPMVNRPYFRGF